MDERDTGAKTEACQQMQRFIERVQGMTETASKIRDESERIGDKLFGQVPEVSSGEDGLSETPNGDIPRLDQCLDFLQDRLRRLDIQVARLRDL